MVTRRSSPPSLFCFLWVLLGLGAVSAVPRDARAQDYDAAGRHFAAGQSRFAAKQFHTSALEFQAAYEITKDSVLLYNIGEAWQKAGEAQKAVASYRVYLKERPTTQDRPELERRIAQIESKRLKVVDESIPGDKAEAEHYDVKATETPTPVAPATVVPAPAPAVVPAVVAPVEPAPAPATVTPPPAPPPAPVGLLDDRPSTRLRTAAWCSVAATIALVTTGAILGLAAQSRGDEISRRLSFVDSSGQPRAFDANARSDFESLRDEGKLYNGLAIGFYTAAGAMAVATTTLFLVDWRRRRKAAETTAQSVRFAPAVSPSSAGLVVGGSF